MPIPHGYVGLVVADTRRALEWEAGLATRGFEVVRVETSGTDVDKGAWQIGVREDQKLPAQRFVSEVLAGRARLPSRVVLSKTARIGLVGIAVILTGVLAAAALRP